MTTVLVIVLIIVLFLWLGQSETAKKRLKDLESQRQAEKEALQQQLNGANTRVADLSRYEGILDAEAKAKELIIEAQDAAATVIADANANASKIIEETMADLKAAKNEAKAIRDQVKARKEFLEKQLTAIRLKSDTILSEAQTKARDIVTEAQNIIDAAHQKAEEIGGDGYKALQNAKEWAQTAKAMKNIIEGYGDRYLKPTYSLLDDLAEEFGHTEAGEKLKEARKRTQLMVEGKMAAQCDYVEAQRRETAIQFVLDAFNGKVDSILSKVKKDNYGTLEQMIKDAYQVVNNNGKAFRNALITEEYLKARLDELKWAVVAQELKWQEQEEQRRIKEQIREEEKARRDYERAMREAQKEEETLRKLIEKAQQQVSQATEAQKADYELKLQALEGRLKEAEEKNQRALSMAQQTKSGNVYIISNIGSFGENVYKIGMTRRLEPLDRVRELGDASVPFEFDVHALIYSDDAPALERELHKKFLRLQINKVNPRKEFFRVVLNDIKQEVEGMGIEAKWTLTAEARQYRESLAIEETIAKDAEQAKRWEEEQLMFDPVPTEELENIA